ncbi:MAG TPA: hypothetical protein ENN80_12190, partial [Candidatus Hydrogenedentes bacterium]|nr:hypothetical protein [Candidatus Hydrogenedentota bacterium]
DLPPEYFTYGIGCEYRVPLYELVFHDCVVTTWYWGDSSGFFYDLAPELSDRKDLFNILYGTAPLMWADEKGYGWDRHRARFLQTYRRACRFHEVVGFDELLGHEFLSDDHALQRTRFASGATAVVNFSDEPREYRSRGEEMVLAARGYYAKGPGIEQARLFADGQTFERIEADGFVSIETQRASRVGPIEGVGRFSLFRVAPERWHMHAEAPGLWRVHLDHVRGFPTGRRVGLVAVDNAGRLRERWHYTLGNKTLSIEADATHQLFALLLDANADDVIIMPEGGEIAPDEPVRLAVDATGRTIRYTLDGSEPRVTSDRYDAPFALEASTVLRARAFVGSEPVGAIATAQFDVIRTLYASDALRGGEEARPVCVPLEGICELRIAVTDAGDGTAYDALDLAIPVLKAADGSTIALNDLTPLYAVRAKGAAREEPTGPMHIGGRTFESGMACAAGSRLAYALKKSYEALALWLGVPDWTEGRGSVVVTITGLTCPAGADRVPEVPLRPREPEG